MSLIYPLSHTEPIFAISSHFINNPILYISKYPDFNQQNHPSLPLVNADLFTSKDKNIRPSLKQYDHYYIISLQIFSKIQQHFTCLEIKVSPNLNGIGRHLILKESVNYTVLFKGAMHSDILEKRAV